MNISVNIDKIKLALVTLFPVVICYIIGTFVASSVCETVLMMELFALLLYVEYKNLLFVAKYLLPLFQVLSFCLGCIVCNHSEIYLYELRIWSGYNGSLNLALVFTIVFVLFLFLFDKDSVKVNGIKEPETCFSKQIISQITLFLMCLYLCYLMIVCLKNPFWNNGMDRFEYAATFLSQIDLKILTYLLYFGVPLGLCIYLFKRDKLYNKMMLLIFVMLYCGVMFCIGNKFGAFFLVISIILIGVCSENWMVSIKNKRMFVLTMSILFLSLSCVYFSHSLVVNNFAIGKVLDGLNSRIAQQGQLWWRSYELQKEEKVKLEELSDELLPVMNPYKDFNQLKMTYSFGIYKIMDLCAPRDVVERKLESGSRYAWSTLSSVFYYFGTLGVVLFAALSPLLFILVTNGIIKHLHAGLFVESGILVMLFCKLNTAFSQSDAFILLSPVSILSYIILIGCICFRSSFFSINHCRLMQAV